MGNQKNAFNDIIETLTFTVKGGGAESKEEPKLDIKKPGVYLHFLRLGLFDKNAKSENEQEVNYTTSIEEEAIPVLTVEQQRLIRIKDNLLESRLIKIDNTRVVKTVNKYENYEEKEISLDEVNTYGIQGLPSLDNFYLHPTSLNTGYIYLINDEDPNDYYELHVDEFGNLNHIDWKYKRNIGNDGKVLDVRVPSGDTVKSKRIHPPGKKLWIAYSPTQWSRAYHTELNADREKRKKRMKLFDCVAIKKETQQSETSTNGQLNGKENKNEDYNIKPLSYKEVETIYSTKNDIRASALQQTLHEIHADEKREDEKGNNDAFEDLFFIIQDPIGTAQDVAAILDEAQDKHRATVESIQTGEDENEIFDRLQSKSEENSNFINTEYGQQANALFTNALTLYKLINCDNKIKDKYEKYLDYDKINTILAFSYRKQQRERIKNIRQDFLKILKSEYYKIHFNDGLRGNDQDTFEVRSIVASHLALLTEHPQHKDRFIDPPEDYKGNNDKGVDDFIENSVNCNDDIRKLLTKEFNFDDLKLSYIASKNGFKLSRRIVKSMKDGFTAYTRHAVRIKNFDIVDKSVKAFKTKSGWHIKVKNQAANSHLAKLGFGVSTKTIEETANIFFDGKGKTIKIKTSERLAKQAAQNKTINIPGQGLGSKTSKVLQDLLDSPQFRKFMAGVELVNTLIKVNSLAEKNSWKNRISFGGATASLASSVLAYQEASMKLAKAPASNVKFIGKVGRIAGLVGSGTSVVMCVWDSKDSYQVRDMDASLAWGFTAAISGVLVADGIVAFGAWLATGTAVGFLSFGWGLVFFILFVGGTALAIYFTDTALEKFLKNNILSNDNPSSSTETIPYKYILALYEERSTLVDNEVARWRDFVTASDDLYDLLISYKVAPQLSGMVDYNKQKDEDKTIMDHIRSVTQPAAGIKSITYKKLVVSITLQKFIHNVSEFTYALVLFPKGVKSNNPNNPPISLSNKTTQLIDDNKLDALQIEFSINEYLHTKMNRSSEFVLFSQTCINKDTNEYWPSQRGKTRYHAYKFNATDNIGGTGSVGAAKVFGELGNTIMNDYLGTNIRIGTLGEINNPKTWE